jgi:hypothetical protein
MNPSFSQPPPVPCSKCGGRLWKYSAFRFKCESCGALFRRILGRELTTLLVAGKFACLALAFVPSVLALIHRLTFERFLVWSAICSALAGLGLMARLAGWKVTLLAGMALGGGLFFVNLLVAVFVGCTGGFVSH